MKTHSQAATITDKAKELLQQKNVLLLIEGTPESQPDQLSELIDHMGIQQLHFSIMADSNSDSAWGIRLVQGLYENRMKRLNKNEVYQEMVKVLGGNLKNFLK